MSSNNRNKRTNPEGPHAAEAFRKYIAQLSSRGEHVGIDDIMQKLSGATSYGINNSLPDTKSNKVETAKNSFKKSLKQITQKIRQLFDKIGF